MPVSRNLTEFVVRPMGEWQEQIRQWAIRKGWRSELGERDRTFGDEIALVVSELAEALEAFRECGDATKVWYTYTLRHDSLTSDGVEFKNLTASQVYRLTGKDPEELGLTPKPEGVPTELADTLIRIFDMAAEYGLNMDFEVARKMAYNEGRERRHGGKHL